MKQHIPALDGLRAIAVLLVVAGHLSERFVHAGLAEELISSTSFWGVGLFFAISGFLITRLLLAEKERTGRIALGLFYARRAIRLWPALWVFLIVCATLAILGVIPLDGHDVWAPVLFISDYITPSHPTTFHTWSLSVEEQFYLVWPLVLLWVGTRHSPRVLTILILAAPAIRVATYLLVPAWRGQEEYQFHQRYDALAMGCLIAIIWDTDQFKTLRTRHPTRLVLLGLGLLAVAELGALPGGGGFNLVVGISLQSAAFVLILAGCVSAPRYLLENRVVRHVGTISYSLYLWQQLFTLARIPLFSNPLVAVVACFLAAEASNRLMERPFDSLRKRLAANNQQ